KLSFDTIENAGLNYYDTNSTNLIFYLQTIILPPVAVIQNKYITQTAGSSILISGANSYDSNSLNLTYIWSQIAGDSISFGNADSSFILSFNKSGTYIFELRVSNGIYTSAPDSIVIVITPAANAVITLLTGQQQLISMNSISDTISFSCADNFGNIIDSPNFTVMRVYPKPQQIIIPLNIRNANQIMNFNLPALNKIGSYIFAVSTNNDTKYFQLETKEREFYSEKWAMFTPILSGSNMYSLLSSNPENVIYRWQPDTIDDEFGSKYRLQNSLQSGFAYWYKYTNAAQETYTINPTGSAIGGSP
ncbi:MAG TPA: hypothetical protein PLM75_09815, partial [bacterium]|nr:hypothetical protein [bacterium]